MKNTKFKTKIIATIGPSSDSPEVILDFLKSGVNMFRFNMKHGTKKWHKEKIQLVQNLAKKHKKKIQVFVDLQGPEIRILTKTGKDINLKRKEKITLGNGRSKLSLTHPKAIKSLKKNDLVLIDDGFLRLKVARKNKASVMLEAIEDCVLKNFKGVNLPGKNIKISSLAKRDIENLEIAKKINIDFIALSFVRNAKDILDLKIELTRQDIKSKIISKIETQKAINNIKEIIKVSDMIMIARGDLGIETPISKLAFYQKEIIKKCKAQKTPVIVATQMLYSMTSSYLPTRAEACDVANAVLDGADALMLSNETATGQYPVQCTKIMADIIKFNQGLIKHGFLDRMLYLFKFGK